MTADVAQTTPRVIIAGAGMSGLCMAVKLKQAGIHSFEIFESADEVGGTWRANTYPNAGCDVPSHLYSFSFATDFDWSERYARQPEILDYFRYVADRFELRPHISFGQKIEQATFDESRAVWTIRTQDNVEHEADIFVSAVGQLNRPFVPDIEGLDSFAGEAWHSAKWNHDFDLSGRRVAVIGNGASAVQFVPQIAKVARSVTVYQRNPNWIQQLKNCPYSRAARWAFRSLPGPLRIARYVEFLGREATFSLFSRPRGIINRLARSKMLRQMKQAIPEEYQEHLIPDFNPGCKRILLSNDYLQSFSQSNVHLETHAIERLTERGIETCDGEQDFYAVIFATGFRATELLQPMNIVGRGGVSLGEAWHQHPKALMGVMAAGFPNLVMLYGPNTNLGHNSIIFMVECQVQLAMKCIRWLQQSTGKTFEAPPVDVDRYDETLRKRLSTTVWAGDCTSWYKTEGGQIVNNWYGSALSYWWQTRRLRRSQIELR